MTTFSSRVARGVAAAALATVPVLIPVGAAAAYDGAVLYEPNPVTNADDKVSFEHAIRLQHSGAANGTILATFERQQVSSTDPPRGWLIYRSTDNGRSFEQISRVEPHLPGGSNALQPNLLELARPAGDSRAGTLFLAGQTGAGGTLTQEVFRSTDQGRTWEHWSDIETYTGGANRPWEPFLIQLDDGRLVAYYSEELQPDPRSQQNIVRRISTDGGRTWGPKVGVWVSDNPVDRPGMPTIARMGDGRWIMAVELCGGSAAGDFCRARIKTSTNGLDWGSGPADMGVRPVSTSGHPIHGNPFVTWIPGGGPNGTVILSAKDLQESLDLPHDTAGGHGQTFLVNYDYGEGPWYELTAPLPWQGGGYQSGYRNAVLPLADGGSVLYLAATYAGAGDRNKVVYGTANAGVLPYDSTFDSGTDVGWNTFGGAWSVSDGSYQNSSGGAGDKAVTGSTGWSDYTIAGDVRLDGTGNAGLLLRVNDPRVGVDAHQGYFVGLSNEDGGVFLGRQNNDWTRLGKVRPLPGGVQAGSWYHVSVRAIGCTFTVSAQLVGGTEPPTTFTHTDSGCTFTRGQVGVRTWNTPAAWRNITVRAE